MAKINEKIFVIDDDVSVRRSLPMLLYSADYEVETFSSSEDFINREPFKGTGCILLDIDLGGKNGLELQEELLQRQYSLPIIFITGKGGVPESVRALKKGAINFLQKPFDDDLLLDSVKEAVLKSQEMEKEFDELLKIQSSLSNLTERELEILEYVVTGMLNKQIAYKLDITEHTVKLHRGSITKKLGVKSVTQLVRIAEKVGLKSPQN